MKYNWFQDLKYQQKISNFIFKFLKIFFAISSLNQVSLNCIIKSFNQIPFRKSSAYNTTKALYGNKKLFTFFMLHSLNSCTLFNYTASFYLENFSSFFFFIASYQSNCICRLKNEKWKWNSTQRIFTFCCFVISFSGLDDRKLIKYNILLWINYTYFQLQVFCFIAAFQTHIRWEKEMIYKKIHTFWSIVHDLRAITSNCF